jgi:hypothetical protein
MTIIRLSARLARLERGSTRRPEDLAEARRRFIEQLIGVLRVLDQGGDPDNLVSRTIVANDGDVVAAMQQLAEIARQRHGQRYQ